MSNNEYEDGANSLYSSNENFSDNSQKYNIKSNAIKSSESSKNSSAVQTINKKVKNSNTINKTKNVKQNSYESDFTTPTNSELPPNDAKKQVDETNKRASESCPAPNNRKTMNYDRPNVYKAKLKNSKRKFFSTEKMTESVSQVILAQRIKTNELQNRITQLNDEIEKLRDENKTLKRVHVREEIARKKLETQETDIERLVKNYSEEVTSLKQSIKKLNNDNKKLSTSIMDKEDELRILRKKNEKLNTILNDKNLIESNELRTKLDVCEKELEIHKAKYKILEHKLELNEKNFKHEIGIELKRQKEMQKKIKTLTDENFEYKVKLEEKDRAGDVVNIYSRINREPKSTNMSHLNFHELSNDKKNRKNKDNNDSKQSSSREEKTARDINDSFKQYAHATDNSEATQAKQHVAIQNENENLSSFMKADDQPNHVILAKNTEKQQNEPKDTGVLANKKLSNTIDTSIVKDDMKTKLQPKLNQDVNHIEIQNKAQMEAENKQKKEKTKEDLEALEELERKKRWTDKKANTDEEVEQKKEDLLAKLFNNTETSTNTTLKEQSNHSKPPKVQNNFNTGNKLLQDRMFSPEVIIEEESTNSYNEKDSDKKLLLGKLFGNMDRSTPDNYSNNDSSTSASNKTFNDFLAYNTIKRPTELNNVLPTKPTQNSNHYIEDIEELSL